MNRLIPLLLCACVTACGGSDTDLEDLALTDDPSGSAAAGPGPVASLEGKRFTVFYQVGNEALEAYADPVLGLPHSSDHRHVFAHSGASTAVSASLAQRIHNARDDFQYAPAFDLHEHEGWLHASEATIAGWARTFRDEAIAAGADYFAFNEAPSTTASDAQVRVQIARILKYLAEPNAAGVSLRGIFFFTEKPLSPANWTTPAEAFWKALDDTCDAVVAEHYHSQGFICSTSLEDLGEHFFALRQWLETSGSAPKRSIANKKYTVLHSSYYAPGASGWQGADSTKISLARFQRNLSRAALATRRTPGGFNRISFAPAYDIASAPGVHNRIRLLARWHYDGDDELSCVAGAPGNCECF